MVEIGAEVEVEIEREGDETIFHTVTALVEHIFRCQSLAISHSATFTDGTKNPLFYRRSHVPTSMSSVQQFQSPCTGSIGFRLISHASLFHL